MTIQAIETRYAGCRFRSRLEARWAVFFDTLGVGWEYEPQGFILSNRARYLPDFLLTDCGTWVEVKGSEAALDKNLMELAADELPLISGKGEDGPRLLILGPIPDVTGQRKRGDLGWAGLETDPADLVRVGFGSYYKNLRPWWQEGYDSEWLTPTVSDNERMYNACDAYIAARSARFEHGESGGSGGPPLGGVIR